MTFLLRSLLSSLWYIKVDVAILWGGLFLIFRAYAWYASKKISRAGWFACLGSVIAVLVVGGLYRIGLGGMEHFGDNAFFYGTVMAVTGLGAAGWLLPVYFQARFPSPCPMPIRRFGCLLSVFLCVGLGGLFLLPAIYCDVPGSLYQPQLREWVEENGGYCIVDEQRFVEVVDLSRCTVKWSEPESAEMLRWVRATALNVRQTSFDSAALETLAMHDERLRSLDISFTSIGDADVPTFWLFRNLKTLFVSEHQFSEAALSQLRQHGIWVYSTPTNPEPAAATAPPAETPPKTGENELPAL